MDSVTSITIHIGHLKNHNILQQKAETMRFIFQIEKLSKEQHLIIPYEFYLIIIGFPAAHCTKFKRDQASSTSQVYFTIGSTT